MNPVDAIRSVWSQYASFKGRARRSEYWWWALFSTLVIYGPFIILGLLTDGQGIEAFPVAVQVVLSLIFMIILIGLLIPGLAVTVRRLHDSDRSGWLYLINFIPYVGWIVVFIFMLLPGTRGPNRHGPDPKGIDHGIFE